jgi:hypothetical protein
MHELQPLSSLLDYWRNFLLSESKLLLEQRIDLSSSCILGQDIKILFTIEKSIETDNILMLEGIVDAELFSNLMLNLLLPNHCLLDDLHGAYKVGSLVSTSERKYLTSQTVPNLPLPSSFSKEKSLYFSLSS